MSHHTSKQHVINHQCANTLAKLETDPNTSISISFDEPMPMVENLMALIELSTTVID